MEVDILAHGRCYVSLSNVEISFHDFTVEMLLSKREEHQMIRPCMPSTICQKTPTLNSLMHL